MAHHTIFSSWQPDSPNLVNRRASKAVSNWQSTSRISKTSWSYQTVDTAALSLSFGTMRVVPKDRKV